MREPGAGSVNSQWKVGAPGKMGTYKIRGHSVGLHNMNKNGVIQVGSFMASFRQQSPDQIENGYLESSNRHEIKKNILFRS